MKRVLLFTVLLIQTAFVCFGQETGNSVPASTNVAGADYPRIDPQHRVLFRINAPKATSVVVSLGNTALTKGDDGFWTGRTVPQTPGFLCYTIKIDGVELNDPSSETFYDAGHIYSCIEIPEQGVDFYDVKDVPHVRLIDLRTPFLGHQELLFDGIHPNAEGAKRLAGVICKELTSNK